MTETTQQVDFDAVTMDFDWLLRIRQGDRRGYANEAGKFEEDKELAYWVWEV
jgi:hypothetical protein